MTNHNAQIPRRKIQPCRPQRFVMLLAAIGCLSLVPTTSAPAAVITLTTGSLFVLPGKPVYAYHFYGGAPTGPVTNAVPYTIQGVTFQSFNVFQPPAGFGFAESFAGSWSYYTAGATPGLGTTPDDTALKGIMQDGTYYYSHINGLDGPQSIPVVGLTPGKAYQVDVLVLNAGLLPAQAQDTLFEFNGGQTNHFTAALDTYYDVRETVAADKSGRIVVNLTSPKGGVADGTGMPRLSAVAVTEVPVPKPAPQSEPTK